MDFSASVDTPLHGVHPYIWPLSPLFTRGSSESYLTNGEGGKAISEDPYVIWVMESCFSVLSTPPHYLFYLEYCFLFASSLTFRGDGNVETKRVLVVNLPPEKSSVAYTTGITGCQESFSECEKLCVHTHTQWRKMWKFAHMCAHAHTHTHMHTHTQWRKSNKLLGDFSWHNDLSCAKVALTTF